MKTESLVHWTKTAGQTNALDFLLGWKHKNMALECSAAHIFLRDQMENSTILKIEEKHCIFITSLLNYKSLHLNSRHCNSIEQIAFAVRNLSKTKRQMLIELGNSYYKHNLWTKRTLHQLPIGILANKLQYCISYCKIY